MKKVLHLHFSGSWEDHGCLQHITQAWVRHSKKYEHYFASAGYNATGIVEGRPHRTFRENRLANRIYNKILRRGKFCCFDLIPIIEEFKPDILHFHNRHDLIDQIMARLSYRPKVVCLYHASYNKLIVPKTANLLLGVSKFGVAWIDRRANPTQPIAVLHNPYSPAPALPSTPTERPLFITYSTRHNGTAHLFEAVTALHQEGYDFDVRAIGHVFPDLQPPKGVTVSRMLPQPEYLDIVAQSSAFVSTSYGTAFSVAVIEAIARRKLVIAPWDIGALDLLPRDSYIAYEAHRPEALAEAIRAFFRLSPAERDAMTQRAIDAASTAYSEATIGAKLEYLYDTIAD